MPATMQLRRRGATQSAPNPTPMTRGASILHRLRHATEQPPEHDDEYSLREFECSRVFVDVDVFMKHILHVPENWRKLWGRTIMRIKRDGAFSISYWDYRHECEIQGVEESRLYRPLVDMANAVLDSLTKDSLDESVKLRTPQRYLRNNPKKVHPKGSNLTRAEPPQVESSDDALDDGSWIPRLKVNGRDPQENHAYPPTPPRSAACATTGLAAENGAVSAPPLLPPRKRHADELFERNQKSRKLHHKSTPGGGGPQAGRKRPREPQRTETDRQKDAHLLVGRYLWDQFSISAFRSHTTIALVDRGRIQFYHANRSVILVSSALSFSESDHMGGLEKLIAIMIAFCRLTLCDNDILHDFHNGKLLRGNQKPPTHRVPRGAVRMQEENELVFGGDPETESFTLTLGEAIHHEPELAGRSTAVLHAKSPEWKNDNLVIKIGWPGSGWGVENEFLDKATSEAKRTTDDEWALKNLPRVLYAQDIVFGSDSTHEEVASLFGGGHIINGEYKYEQRTLRIIIQERLYPLTELTDVKDIAQVLLDVACVHRWLYERAGILHRDLSLTNIMYRITGGKVYGVLTDYDLASWTSSMTGDYTKTSEQRAGTPLFMAFGLLEDTDALHLYRHDVESLFYIMVILTTHYEIRAPKKGGNGGVRVRQGKLPFELWFDEPLYENLASFKHTFLFNFVDLDLSPTFKDFRNWLLKLYASFTHGIQALCRHNLQQCMSEEVGDDVDSVAFDEETLGGHVTYSALIRPSQQLTGALKGLVIRYDPPLHLPSSSTGAAQADT